MIAGAHMLMYAEDAPAARAFMRDKLGFDCVDDGDGWLIFALPPAELGVHPSTGDSRAELFLMCRNIEETRAELQRKGIEVAPATDAGFGLLTHVDVPGAGKLGLYQPKHRSPLSEFGS